VWFNEEDNTQNVILLNSVKGKYEFPELKAMAHEQYADWQPDSVVVEAKASGQPLIDGQALDLNDANFDAVLRGSLRRHRESLEALASNLPGLPDALEWPGLNEYDSEAVVRSVHAGDLPRPDTPEAYRLHFRLLREGLARWMAGEVQPEGMPTWQGFLQGVTTALDHVRTQHQGDVLLQIDRARVEHPVDEGAEQEAEQRPRDRLVLDAQLLGQRT
jgi:hypothetical protein